MRAFVLGSVLLLATATSGYHLGHADAYHHAAAEKAWHGPIHIPVIHKGVPVEPKEVQHARAEHAAAYAKVQAQQHYAPAEHYGHHEHHDHHEEAKSYGAWHGPQHVPVIHNGVPVETAEVQHAKAFHLNALANAGAHSGHAAAPAWGHGHEDDGSYDPAKYEKEAHHLYKRSAHWGYVPADTPEVSAAKAAHFAAHAAVKTGHGPIVAPIAAHHQHWDHAEKAWHGPIHIPVIHKGVPVEPKEVQHAKAEHAAAYAKVQGHGHYAPAPQEHYGHHGHHEEAKSYGAWHGPQHVPVIHNGVPVETPEVQHAKAFHLNAVANAGAHSGHVSAPAWGHGHEDDGSYDPAKYEHEAY